MKPIFIVGIPNVATQEEIVRLQKDLDKQFNDYYVLVYTHHQEELKFDCFYEKDFNEVKYEELKRIVKEQAR